MDHAGEQGSGLSSYYESHKNYTPVNPWLRLNPWPQSRHSGLFLIEYWFIFMGYSEPGQFSALVSLNNYLHYILRVAKRSAFGGSTFMS